MERAFESTVGPAQLSLSPTMLALVVAKLGSVVVVVVEADTSLLEGEWESGSWSDSPALGGGGAATSSYLDAEGR